MYRDCLCIIFNPHFIIFMLYPQLNRYRFLTQLDGYYNFCADRDNDGKQKAWHKGLPNTAREMAVPGSWNEQYSDLYDFHGVGWYEKKFQLPPLAVGQRVWLRVGSAATNATVWLNGHELGRHIGAHLPFEFELTSHLLEGENTLILAVDNTLKYISLPPGQARRDEDRAGFWAGRPDLPYDFYPFGGIHRPVFLYTTASERIVSIKVDTDYTDTLGRISFRAAVQGRMQSDRMTVTCGQITVACAVVANEVEDCFEIPSVELWSPENPYRYNLIFRLFSGEMQLDEYRLAVGVRRVSFTKTQLLLNEKPVFLKGFGKHEDFPILGKGVVPALAIRDFDLMRWTGANSFRTSHYPYAEETLELADRQGILVISETPFVSLAERIYKDKEMLTQAKQVIGEMIERDYNHPCVIAWSLANEPFITCEEGDAFFKSMADTARACDRSRPIMYVAHQSAEVNKAGRHYDLLGVNRYFGWYEHTGYIDESLGALVQALTEFHEELDKPILFAEFGADAVAGLHSEPAVLFSEEYQSETIEKQYLAVKDLPFIIGTHVWNFADFKTAQTINRVGGNKKGVFTRAREPKLAAHTLKRLWNTDYPR